MKNYFFILICTSFVHAGYRMAIHVAKQYKRTVTVFEYGDAAHMYTYRLAAELPRGSQSVLAITDDSNEAIDLLQGHQVDDAIVLASGEMSIEHMSRLGGCEHFDIAIVHSSFVQKTRVAGAQQLLDVWLGLGDYILVEQPIAWRDQVKSGAGEVLQVASGDAPGYEWVLYKVMRKTLKRTRWAANVNKRSFDEYIIHSTFTEKKLIKNPGNFQSTWLPGINFVTFLMMHGRLPHTTELRKAIKQFKKISHNDLVVGNMLVQGGKLRAIDVGDPHRNFSQKRCIKAALYMLRWTDWQDEPQGAMHDYADKLHNK